MYTTRGSFDDIKELEQEGFEEAFDYFSDEGFFEESSRKKTYQNTKQYKKYAFSDGFGEDDDYDDDDYDDEDDYQ